jgi:hypothetical protein
MRLKYLQVGSFDSTNCACWICNSIKGDLTLEQMGWELKPSPRQIGLPAIVWADPDWFTSQGLPMGTALLDRGRRAGDATSSDSGRCRNRGGAPSSSCRTSACSKDRQTS